MPAGTIDLLTLSGVANGAVAARRAVGFNDAQATVQGQKVKGIAAYGAASGHDFAIIAKGVAPAEAGAAFSKGDSLIVDSQGRVIASTGKLAIAAGSTAVTSAAANGTAVLTGGDGPEYVFADALQDSSGAGAIVEILFR
ncbi:MAG: DUF2190 family protein [Magnetospirillum sp.]|nr:DUF2190 family protein [Magnetospirillum sp.]